MPQARALKQTMRLGGGDRFKALSSKLAKQPGVKNPDALVASIGIKKYGKKKMASMASKHC